MKLTLTQVGLAISWTDGLKSFATLKLNKLIFNA